MEAALVGAVLGGLVLLAGFGLRLVMIDPLERQFGELELRREMRPEDKRSPLTSMAELIGRRLGPSLLNGIGRQRRDDWERLLDAAGRPQGLTVELLAVRKAGFAVLFGGVGILFALNGSWWIVVTLFVLGYLLPTMVVSSEAKERQEEVDRSLPDFLDVLAVTVSAGLDFRAALGRVSDAFEGPLPEEVRTALQQMALGESRREALEGLRTRNSSESLSEFVSALQQAEDLGSPLQSALTEIAADVRRSYAQEARRKAAKVEPRLSLLLTVTLIPASLLIVGVGSFIHSGIDLGRMLGGG
jgi:tight adherence protein C